MSHTDVTAITPLLAGLAQDEVASPTMPVAVFCAQGELMRVAAMRDCERLVAAGVPPTIVADFGT